MDIIEDCLRNRQSLVLLIGPAGCGKTTLAMSFIGGDFNPKITRVNLDSIIEMKSGYNYDYELKNFYRELEFLTARKSLEYGHTVIVDDTNIKKDGSSPI